MKTRISQTCSFILLILICFIFVFSCAKESAISNDQARERVEKLLAVHNARLVEYPPSRPSFSEYYTIDIQEQLITDEALLTWGELSDITLDGTGAIIHFDNYPEYETDDVPYVRFVARVDSSLAETLRLIQAEDGQEFVFVFYCDTVFQPTFEIYASESSDADVSISWNSLAPFVCKCECPAVEFVGDYSRAVHFGKENSWDRIRDWIGAMLNGV